MGDDDLVRMNRVLRHRLRNVASGVKSAVNVLREEAEDVLPPDSMEYFPLLVEKCDQLTELTTRMSDLFDYSASLEAAHDREHDGQMSVGILLERLVAEVHSRWPSVTMLLECDDRVARMPAPSARVMSRVLSEILRNAAETSKTAEIDIVCEQENGIVRFSVSDSGGTAPLPDDFEAIFLPFWTTKSGHDGIGLAVAMNLISGLDGAIEARKNGKDGVTVIIEIPVPQGEGL